MKLALAVTLIALAIAGCGASRFTAEFDTRTRAEGDGWAFDQWPERPAVTVAPPQRFDHCTRVPGVGCVDRNGVVVRP